MYNNTIHMYNDKGHFNPYGAPTCVTVAESGEEKVKYYNCEIGDLSGRDGNLYPKNDGSIKTMFRVATRHCPGCHGRLTPEAVYQRSVVVHCSDGPRLFCAPFELSLI